MNGLGGWESFLLSEVGASAALAGLIFVGVSINLKRILSVATLPNRAAEALLLLMTVLIVCSLLLVPGQSQTIIGIEVLIAGLVIWALITLSDIRIWHKTEAQYRPLYARLMVFNQVALIPYIISGIAILLLYSWNGLYWLAPAIILSFMIAILDAWVLLVEINR